MMHFFPKIKKYSYLKISDNDILILHVVHTCMTDHIAGILLILMVLERSICWTRDSIGISSRVPLIMMHFLLIIKTYSQMKIADIKLLFFHFVHTRMTCHTAGIVLLMFMVPGHYFPNNMNIVDGSYMAV